MQLWNAANNKNNNNASSLSDAAATGNDSSENSDNEQTTTTTSNEQQRQQQVITMKILEWYWKQEMEPYNIQDRFFRLVARTKDYIVRDDFLPFIKALLQDHPGLQSCGISRGILFFSLAKKSS